MKFGFPKFYDTAMSYFFNEKMIMTSPSATRDPRQNRRLNYSFAGQAGQGGDLITFSRAGPARTAT